MNTWKSDMMCLICSVKPTETSDEPKGLSPELIKYVQAGIEYILKSGIE